MADRVRLYSRGGKVLADPRVMAARSWIINEEGEGEFDIVTGDPSCREDFLRFGNWLLIENDKLPPWVGMIDESLEWHRRYVHVRAYSAVHQLIYRNVPRDQVVSGKSGNIFKKVLNLCNVAETTILEAGNIWTGGIDLPAENMSGDNLMDYVTELARKADAEFNFTPVVNAGRLDIKANWYDRMGVDSVLPFEESYNLSDEMNSIRVQGKNYNELWGYGSGATQADKPTAKYHDAASVSLYGLRQGSRNYSDYADDGAVQAALKNEINTTKDPRNTFKLSALDVNNTFSYVRKGNVHRLRMWSVGFGVLTKVRIMAMIHDPLAGYVELTVDEVRDDSAR